MGTGIVFELGLVLSMVSIVFLDIIAIKLMFKKEK